MIWVRAADKSRHTAARVKTAIGLLALGITAISGLLSTRPAEAAVGINKQINFQGKVVNSNGTNVTNGTYTFVFNLYTVSSGGSSVWSDTASLSVTDGIFQYELGSDTVNSPLPGSVDFNSDNIYLGINFNGDGEMTPRIRFTASPYSFNSDLLDGLDASAFAQLNPASAQSGSLNVTGTVQAATSVQAPLVDTATAVAMNIGTGTATSVTIGRTTTPFTVQGNSSSTFTATSGGNTTTVGFTTPTGTNSIVFPDAGGTVCTTVATTCSATYQAAGSYLAKNAADTSSFAVTAANYLYGFTNSSSAVASGVLKLDNGSNTGNALLVTGSGNPAAGSAYITVNNTAGSPSGNFIDIQTNGTSKFSVSGPNGDLTSSGNINNGSNTVTTGNLAASVAVRNTSASTTAGYFSKVTTAGTGGWAANDVVVLDSSAAGVTTTTARDSRVYGVGVIARTAGQGGDVAIAGNFQVTADTGAVAIGDQLVTSTSAGQVTVDNTATTGILGRATTSKSAGSAGLVGVMIRPVNGTASVVFSGTVTAGTSLLAPLVDTASAGVLEIGTNNATSVDLKKNTNVTGNITFTNGANRTISNAAPGTNVAGDNLTIAAGAAGTGGAAFSGGLLTLQGGAAAGTGNAAGGNVRVVGGAGVGTGAAGTVQLAWNGSTAQGNVAVGQASASYLLDAAGDINTSTLYRVGGTAGLSSIACASSAVLQGTGVKGGIVTSGVCKANTLQNAYDNSGASPVKVQEVDSTTASSPFSTTVAATGAGNLLIAIVGVNAGTSNSVSSITDNGGNTWVLAGAGAQSGANNRVEIWYAKNTTSTTSITTTLASSTSATIKILEYSNMDPSAPLDIAAAQGNASSTTAGTATINTTNSTDLIIGAMSYSSSSITSTAPGAPWSNYADNTVSSTKQVRSVYRLVAATGSYNTSWTLSSAATSGTVIAAFKTAGAITSTADITLADSKDLNIIAAEAATDPSVVINLQCTTCSASGGRFAVQNSGTDVFTVSPNNGGISLGANTTVATGKNLTVFDGTLTVGNSAGTGALVNNGTTTNTTLALGNLAAGPLGTAAATVDIYTGFSIAPTSSGRTYTIPTPTASTAYGRTIYISNIASAGNSFTLLGTTMNPGATATLVWANTSGGASWQFAGADGNGILNQNSADQTADFRISGTGRANTSFTSPLFDSITGGLSLGTSTATGVTIGGTTNTTAIGLQGATAATYTIGTTTGTGQITLGQSTASNTISIGSAATATGNTQTINIGAGTPAGTGKATITIGNTNGASGVTIQGGTAGVTFGSAAGQGLVTNNGSFVNSTLALANIAGGGSIGTAAATVDIYTSISVAQTTASQTLTLPTPTASTTYGRMLYISNIGTVAFTLLGTTMNPGATATLIWSNTNGGASWQFAGADGNGILNQNAADQTANFRISGTGRANTSFTSPAFDSITGGVSLGNTTATSVTLGGTTNTATVTLQGATSANYNIGTTTGTGTITVGQSTASNTINIGNANTATGNTQNINIGAGAPAGTGRSVITIGNTTAATAVTLQAGSAGITLGSAAGQGFTRNNGAFVNTTLALTNFASGGSIGTAAATVDVYTSISVAQTTASQTLTIPTPTANTTYGRMLYISNIGTAAFTLLGTTMNPGATATLTWANTNGGASWQFAGADGNGILNQNSADQTANFRISGTGRANTSFITPTIDSITGILSVGTGTATGITIGGATTTGTISIGNSAASTINIGTGAQAHTIAIGTDATAIQGLTLGSTFSTSATTIQAGSGNINLNAATVATNQTVLALVNTTATTVNAFGAASTLNMGASGGNVTFGGTGGGGSTLRTTNGALTITSAAAATWSTSAGNLTIDSAASLSLGGTNATALNIGRTGVTNTLNGNTRVGASAGTGSLTNNGSTVNSTLALTNFAGGGSIGTAATTVDIYTSISIAQTTASQTLTLPTPTANTVYGRMLYISNIGSAAFTLLGTTMNPGATATLVWSNTNGGASWQFGGADGNGILNQNAADQTANFRISGTGRANTSFTAPLFDAIAAGNLNFGTSTATSITIGGTVTTGTIAIANGGVANTLQLGNTTGAVAQTINIGNNTTAASTTTLLMGSTIGTSTTTIQAGSGGVNLVGMGYLGGTSASSVAIVDTANFKLRVGTGTPTLGSGGANSTAALFVSGAAEFAGQLRVGDGTNNVAVDGTTKEVTFNGTARHTRRVNLVPEYEGATMSADGSNNAGFMTSDFCSGTSRRSINTGVCAATVEHNYYNWAASLTGQDYDIWVRYQIPSDFAAFSSDTSINMFGYRKTATANDLVELSLFQANGTQCGSTTNVATGTDVWTETALTGSETGCTVAAGDIVTFRIKTTSNGAAAPVAAGEIRFDYLSKW